MNKFEEELEKGNFFVGTCSRCKKDTWPPSDFCSICFNETNWRKISNIGNIIEFSKKGNVTFCLTQFEESIRIIGSLLDEKQPKIGQKVRLDKCGVNNGNIQFSLKLLK